MSRTSRRTSRRKVGKSINTKINCKNELKPKIATRKGSKIKMIKAILGRGKNTESIWVSHFNEKNLTGKLANHPLNNRYSFADKVKIALKRGRYDGPCGSYYITRKMR